MHEDAATRARVLKQRVIILVLIGLAFMTVINECYIFHLRAQVETERSNSEDWKAIAKDCEKTFNDERANNDETVADLRAAILRLTEAHKK
jgi:hypothetical protein